MTTAATERTTLDPEIQRKGYAKPDVLVTTSWLAEHLHDPNVRIVESDEDVLLFDTGHIPGAQKVDWHLDLNDPVVRDYVNREQFEELLRSKGIDDSTTVVFYGDKNNWWATYAFWVFQLFGVKNLRLMDGGRLLQAEFQQRFAGHLYLLPFREHLHPSASAAARCRTNGSAFTAARDSADDRSHDRAAATFLRAVRASALSLVASFADAQPRKKRGGGRPPATQAAPPQAAALSRTQS